MTDTPAAEPRRSLEERVAEMKVRRRDCRTCRAFQPDESGLGFGWCTAFEQYVKLYHPAGEFWSQCQFKVISKAVAPEKETAEPQNAAGQPASAPAAKPGWSPSPAAQPE